MSWNVYLVYTESTQLHTTLHSVYIDTLSTLIIAVYMNIVADYITMSSLVYTSILRLRALTYTVHA